MPEDRHVDDAAPHEDLRAPEHALVVSLGQDDATAVRLRALDQLVLEHDRRHARGSLERDPPVELRGVHAGVEGTERRCDLALAVGADQRAHRLDRGGSDMDRLLRLDHREGRALEQPAQRVGQRVAAADEDTGNGRDHGGDHRCEARDEDVRPIGRNDDQRSLDEILDEVLDAHRSDSEAAHLAVELLVRPRENLRVELGGHLRDGWKRELGPLRHDVDRLVAVLLRDPAPDLVDELLGHPVHEDAEDRAALVLQRIPGCAHRGDRLVGRATLDDDEDGRSELVGEIGVQPVVQGRGGAREVCALAEDEVETRLERLVLGDDPLPELVVGRNGARLVLRQRPHLLGGRVELVPAAEQIDLRIRSVPGRDDRPEEPQPVHPGGEELHQPERDDGLAALRLHRGDVEVACQGPDWSLSLLPR